jgi:hypothetical protein
MTIPSGTKEERMTGETKKTTEENSNITIMKRLEILAVRKASVRLGRSSKICGIRETGREAVLKNAGLLEGLEKDDLLNLPDDGGSGSSILGLVRPYSAAQKQTYNGTGEMGMYSSFPRRVLCVDQNKYIE